MAIALRRLAGAILILASAWCLYRFGIIMNWWSPVNRPATVSKEAHYVFVWESAAWFDCRVDEIRNVDVCRAWDNSGRLLAAGDFRIKGEDRAATKEELKPSAVGATNLNGLSDTIYLFGPKGLIEGKQLVRVGSRDATEKSKVS